MLVQVPIKTLFFIISLAFFSVFAATVVAAPSMETNEDEPLPPDQAFQFSIHWINPQLIRAKWLIADGYYLYRDKFKFNTTESTIALREPAYPKGKIKKDDFFGVVETYRHSVAIDIPIKNITEGTDSIEVLTSYQGCADIGICYPPQKKTSLLQFAFIKSAAAADTPPPAATNSNSAFNALKKLGQSLGLTTSSDEFLLPDQAFIFTAEITDNNTAIARWQITDGYYLYKDKFRFEIQDTDAFTLGTIALPEGDIKEDEFFGRTEVYYNQVEINVPLLQTNSSTNNQSREITLVAHYQGCADAGLCYPPQSTSMPLAVPAAAVILSSLNSENSIFTPASSAPANLTQNVDANNNGITNDDTFESEQDKLATLLLNSPLWLSMLIFFGLGVGLSFTPCVFPMIPILSSIIAGQSKTITTRKAFFISLVYVLAMAVTYTIAGVFAGLFGENLQAMFQNPWIIGSFSFVFVLLALSMFGFYELQMPSFLQSKLTEISNRQSGGSFFGVAIMGFLSALIVGPCVAAPLAGALLVIGQSGDPLLGGSALFAMSMGMGIPLLAIGTSAGKLLPKAGDWMSAIKAVFGVLLLALAIWMLERILPASISLVLWAILLILSAIYMGALEQLDKLASGWRKLWKGVGLIMLLYGVLIVIGAVSGGTDIFQPLGHLGLRIGNENASSTSAHSLQFKRIKSIADLDREIQKASVENKPVMLDFYADWCISCKEMDRFTFSDPDVQTVLKQAVILQADVTANDATDKALLKHFRLLGPPSILFFDKQGNEKTPYRLVGFVKAKAFHQHIKRALGLN